MSNHRVDELWEDRRHWTWGVIYHCASDPRAIVPRRYRWGGWTLNFGHPNAGVVGIAAVAFAVGPTLLALLFTKTPEVLFTVMLASGLGVAGYAHHEASKRD